VIYLEQNPSPALSAVVDKLWFISTPPVPHQYERVLPDGRFQIIISLTDDPLIDCTSSGPRPMSSSVVAGPDCVYRISATRNMAAHVGLVLHSGGFSSLAREKASQFLGKNIALEDIWNIDELRDRLIEKRSMPQLALAIADHFLVGQLSNTRSVSTVRAASKMLAHLSVRETARQLGFSERRLHGLFRDEVGVSPKQWARLRRFNRITALLHQEADLRWSELAIECGYADQAHFSRDFKAFAGIDPTTYIASQGKWQNHLPIDDIATSDFFKTYLLERGTMEE
jgi:AraC-like DNA-binding protein